ncbi:hypothetical protein NDU88_002376 [Pleurodeles waltl]|uniref:Uncharacterized protein n=1 Tax=Pleurodeles waltl TaxID=8319 RepID=A0AAV7WQH7_PLEWA|nr:hypothetical protein NDU88_002376 [Pleurodeles waltl]
MVLCSLLGLQQCVLGSGQRCPSFVCSGACPRGSAAAMPKMAPDPRVGSSSAHLGGNVRKSLFGSFGGGASAPPDAYGEGGGRPRGARARPEPQG